MGYDVWRVDDQVAGFFQRNFIPNAGVAVRNRLNPIPPRRELRAHIARNGAIAALTAIGVAHRVGWIHCHSQTVAAVLG